MRIYLKERLLVKTKVFPDIVSCSKEEDKRFRQTSLEDVKRDWMVYTWNSKGKLMGEDDGYKPDPLIIEASLKEYTTKYDAVFDDEFKNMGLTKPYHKLIISAYHSLIPTSRETMMDIIRRLEVEEISCLLTPMVAPIFTHYEYMSPRLEEKIVVEL